MRDRARSWTLHGIATLALVSAAGCATDTTNDPGPLRIEATVHYTGAAHGSLVVAAFKTMPPTGAPMAFAQKAAPMFPMMVTLGDTLEPSTTVYVLAMLDVAPASPQQPGPEDRTVWSSALTLMSEGAVPVDLALTDP